MDGIHLTERHRSCRSQRNALVGGSKQHIKLESMVTLGCKERFRIESGESAQQLAAIEQSGIEEIRGFAPRLGREFPKHEYAGRDCKPDKVLTKVAQNRPFFDQYATKVPEFVQSPGSIA